MISDIRTTNTRMVCVPYPFPLPTCFPAALVYTLLHTSYAVLLTCLLRPLCAPPHRDPSTTARYSSGRENPTAAPPDTLSQPAPGCSGAADCLAPAVPPPSSASPVPSEPSRGAPSYVAQSWVIFSGHIQCAAATHMYTCTLLISIEK